MNRSFIAIACAVVVVSALVAVPNAMAQRPWRANMYNPYRHTQRYYAPNYGYRMQYAPVQAQAPTQATQSFSAEPNPFHEGDQVKVSVNTEMRRGNDMLANLAAGDIYTVIQVSGPWVGIAADQNGKEVRGWVNFRALETP